jgi:hypothetical protein
MKMSDVVRQIADLLDQGGSEEGGHPENMGKSADDFQHDVEDSAETGGAGDVEVGTFVPPLQQKLELLKKVAGEPSALDDKNDELDAIKKLSGVPKAAVVQISSEDNDITG